MSKLREELAEFSEVLAEKDPKTSRLEEEFGDLLFAAVNIARHLKLDPEAALRKATFKFQRRFGYLEEALEENKKASEMPILRPSKSSGTRQKLKKSNEERRPQPLT